MAQETRNAYGQELAKLITEREDIVVLDADLTKSTKTAEAKKACPERHFNAGIAEANMMGMAAGLAASGKTVFASSFPRISIPLICRKQAIASDRLPERQQVKM